MTTGKLSASALATLLSLLVLAGPHRPSEQDVEAMAAAALAATPATSATHAGQDFLYGRVTTDDSGTYEGRLRFGGDEEAFWGNYFNGVKAGNPWAETLERLGQRRAPIKIFGFEIPLGDQMNLTRPLMARFGDIARLEARGRDLWVTLKSGTVVHLNRFAADDYADGLRVWDARRGVVDLDEWRIRAIEFLPTPRLDTVPARLHGTVRTADAAFTGFIQWDREECVGSDELVGRTAQGEVRLRFDTIRAIARRSPESSEVTLLDGRTVVLTDARKAGEGRRGIYVDDRRYGRVLVSWDAFDRLDFSAGGAGPAYGDFPPGRALTGSVATRDGRRLTGRIVYDLDESETTETLDAPWRGVDYTIPIGLVASIVRVGGAERATVTLHDGEQLPLERAGDLGEGHAGILIFVDGAQDPAYVHWIDVDRIEFDRPAGAQRSALGVQRD